MKISDSPLVDLIAESLTNVEFSAHDEHENHNDTMKFKKLGIQEKR